MQVTVALVRSLFSHGCSSFLSAPNRQFCIYPLESGLSLTMTHLQSNKAAQHKVSGTALAPDEKCSSSSHSRQSPGVSPLGAKRSKQKAAENVGLLDESSLAGQPGQNRFSPLLNSGDKADAVASPEKIDILGMDFDNLTPQEFLTSLRKGIVFTPNVDHLMKLRKDPEFVSVYERADFKICDSQIVMYASRFLGTPLKAKLSGSDLFPWFCDYHKANDDIRIFLLGGQTGVAKVARDRINARTGREIVVGEYSPPFGFEHSESECDQVVSVIEQSSANVVAVCLGAPKQEKWIAANCDRLPNVDIFMAVGAVVDFEAGAKPRAPQFVSELGLEWLYRLSCEPKRLWRRYLLEDMPFVGLILAEKLKRLSSPRR